MSNEIDMDKLADAMGYETIKWDDEHECYSGYGSSDPMDRSRDDEGGFYVAGSEDELAKIANQELSE